MKPEAIATLRSLLETRTPEQVSEIALLVAATHDSWKRPWPGHITHLAAAIRAALAGEEISEWATGNLETFLAGLT